MLEVIREIPPHPGHRRLVLDPDTGQHYILSDVGYETLAFKSDAEGEITDWKEQAGRMHGGQTIDEVQAELEQRLATGASARDDNIDAAGGPLGMMAAALDDIAKNI